MSLKISVKVGGVTNLSDARYCAGMGVELLGFTLDPASPQYITPETYADITGWLAGVKFVGEFEGMEIENIKLATQNYTVDYLETNNQALLEELSMLGLPIIYKLEIIEASDIEKLGQTIQVLVDYCEQVIVSCELESLFEKLDLAIKSLSDVEVPILSAFAVNQDTIEAIVAEKNYSGIALKGSEEELAGFKDYGELMDLLELLDED